MSNKIKFFKRMGLLYCIVKLVRNLLNMKPVLNCTRFILCTCADPESFVRGGPSSTTFLLLLLFFLVSRGEEGSKYHY